MKRTKLIKHLREMDCILFREGKKHSLYINTVFKKISTVPRHREINDYLAIKICKDLGIKKIK